ncbi:MAG: HAD family hydrolase [Candidatus Aenigmatarchaeota archaeon]
MGAPKLFIFGVDGVLRDSSKALNEGIARGFISVGLPHVFTSGEVWNMGGIGKYNSRERLVEALYTMSVLKIDPKEILCLPGAEERLDYLIAHNLHDADRHRIEQICRTSREFSNSQRAKYMVKEIPNSRDALDILTLKSRNAALFTNSGIDTLYRDLGNIGLKRFSYILSKEGVKNKKPSGEGLKKIMAHLKVSPEETVHIGDTVSDVKAAKDAGCLSAAVLSGMGLKHHLEREKPDYLSEDALSLIAEFG